MTDTQELRAKVQAADEMRQGQVALGIPDVIDWMIVGIDDLDALLDHLDLLEQRVDVAETLNKGFRCEVRELQDALSESETYRISFRDHVTRVNERNALLEQAILNHKQSEPVGHDCDLCEALAALKAQP